MSCICGIVSSGSKQVVAYDVETARTFLSRAIGLLGSRSLPAGRALIIPACKQVHTFFMRYSIDVVFVDKNGEILGAVECLPPWRVTGYYPRAASTIELPAGTISSCGLHAGDHLTFEDTNR